MSNEDDELERMRKLMPPASATPNYAPIPGADEALATGQRIRVMKQNRKTLPSNSGSDFDPHTGLADPQTVDGIMRAARKR
jgi:hypothetical protein